MADHRKRIAAIDAVGTAAARLDVAREAVRDAGVRAQALALTARLAAEEREAADVLARAKAAVRELSANPREAAEFDDVVRAIGTLDARVPVAFLPIRIETRFRRDTDGPDNPGTGELLVRIYPDAILADPHEPLLTANELAAGRTYWRRTFGLVGAQDPARDPDLDAWTAILGEATEQRAAWIVERTTPSNLGARGSGAEPEIPELELRPEGWHRAPEARALPEHWIVTLVSQTGQRRRVVSKPILDGLALTPRLSGDGPDNPGDAIDLSGDGLAVEPELAWAYDFDKAVAVGMGIRIALDPVEMANGFDLVMVSGVRTGDPADAQAEELEALLNAHRFSGGLSFLPQGTRTNNTTDRSSSFPPADPAGMTSFPIRRGPAQAGQDTDGGRVAAALGIRTAPLDHIRGAGRDEQTPARAMTEALWPSTIGYFLNQLMAPLIRQSDTESVRTWMRDWVRARGPLPAFAVGEVPYGILPVGDLDSWGRLDNDGTPARLVDLLRDLADRLSPDAAPHLGRSDDGNQDLIEVLAMDASSQGVRARRAIGYDALWNVLTFSGGDLGAWEQAQRRAAARMIRSLGEDPATFDPRVLYLSHAARSNEFRGPLVTDEPLSETEPLSFDYIAWLLEIPPSELRAQTAPPTDEPVNALLYLMLRHALLAAYDRAARHVLRIRRLDLEFEGREPELIEIVQSSDQVGDGLPPPLRTVWERFEVRVGDVTAESSLGEFLAQASTRPPPDLPAELRPIIEDLAGFHRSLKDLVGLPTAELERLFTETLDITSHRLDAWVTSLATRRLAAMRQQTPSGLWLGCYGWVLNLRPDQNVQERQITLPEGTVGVARTDSDGYLYAPSMMHGATAAVLRSAYRSRSGPEQEPYTVNLDSRRVRTALGLLDAVRDSQPLGAVLGYRFERGLHDRSLDRFIDAFRGLFPLVANKAEDSGEPAEAVAARNVVDGLALQRAWNAGTIPFGTGELPAAGSQRDEIEDEVRQLDDATDALSDLLLAETVHQIVKGSAAGAAATLDTLAKGQRPPEPEVAAIPRGGTVLHQRVALVLGDGSPAPGWTGSTPRATAAPEVNAWLGRLLGPATALGCTATPQNGTARTVTVADLGLQAVDLAVLAGAAPAEAGQTELDRRITWHVIGNGPDVAVTIDYDTTQAGVPLGAALELAAAAGKVLGFGRPLAASDLLPPETDQPPIDALLAEITARAAASRTALETARTALVNAAADVAAGGTLPALQTALVAAAGFGVSGAHPPTRNTNDREALETLAVSVIAELDRRIAAATRASTPPDELAAVFGRDLPVVPRCRPASPELLGAALATEPGLGTDPDATVDGWFAQLARIRPPLDAWRDVQIMSRALDRGSRRPQIVQIPLENKTVEPPEPADWAGMPFSSAADRHRSGLVSLALLGEPPPAADQPWAGLLLDSWPEVIANVEEDAGVVFHFDAPTSEAPQAILLAVPSKMSATWDFGALERTLLATLRMAQLRALDLPGFGVHGQFLPMTFLAANKANEAVSTSFTGLLRADAVIATDGG